MRKTTIALTLVAILAPLAGYANTTEEEESQEAKWARIAAQAKPGPCPTEVEVLPYQWIEPTTGMEYTMLRLHCPGRDDLEGDSPSSSSAGDDDTPSPASVSTAS
jgi:hypothetical protein